MRMYANGKHKGREYGAFSPRPHGVACLLLLWVLEGPEFVYIFSGAKHLEDTDCAVVLGLLSQSATDWVS